jgi:hypothetical protein
LGRHRGEVQSTSIPFHSFTGKTRSAQVKASMARLSSAQLSSIVMVVPARVDELTRCSSSVRPGPWLALRRPTACNTTCVKTLSDCTLPAYACRQTRQAHFRYTHVFNQRRLRVQIYVQGCYNLPLVDAHVLRGGRTGQTDDDFRDLPVGPSWARDASVQTAPVRGRAKSHKG